MTQATYSPSERPIVIAHRGASGYLPEHTLVAKALAFGMQADYIEQDVVLTKDDHAVVLHDIYLDTVSNAADVFPGRSRSDGRFYVMDFTLAEIKSLRVRRRIDRQTGELVYPGRFSAEDCVFTIATLEEEIILIKGLNRAVQGSVGLYTEIKAPAWHRRQGKDISAIVLGLLKCHGFESADDNIYLQCFDPAENQRIRLEFDCRLKLVQLIGENEWNEADVDFDQLRTEDGIERIATYADGIGPCISHVVAGIDDQGKPIVTEIVNQAHRHGLTVHPYTFRADELPEYARSFDQMLRFFFVDAGVDGVFTDFPDQVIRFRNTAL